MTDKGVEDYAVVAIKIINQARREGYDPPLIAAAVSSLNNSCLSLKDIKSVPVIRNYALSLLMTTAIIEDIKRNIYNRREGT